MANKHRLNRIASARSSSGPGVEVRLLKTILYAGDSIEPGPRTLMMLEHEAARRIERGEVELVQAKAAAAPQAAPAPQREPAIELPPADPAKQDPAPPAAAPVSAAADTDPAPAPETPAPASASAQASSQHRPQQGSHQHHHGKRKHGKG